MAAYLAQDEIIRIAKLHDVSMIHPGYGFLSENASFAQKCADNGIAFVGPDANVIDALGDKTKARDIGRCCSRKKKKKLTRSDKETEEAGRIYAVAG